MSRNQNILEESYVASTSAESSARRNHKANIKSASEGQMNHLKGCCEDFLFSTVRQMYRKAMKPLRQQTLNPYFATIIYCCEWQFCFVTEMYVLVYPPSVLASVSYCALSLSVCQGLASTHFKCYFYPNTQRGLWRLPFSVHKVCLVISANFRWWILIIIIITTRMTVK